ncbi:MAG: MFS transporter [Hyphomicrobiales bacterium]|nr:MFS transporter [Hyphomicrobiales bacterium]MCP5374012.1 MFS transporter [Hyphomicrobiales bacterium]
MIGALLPLASLMLAIVFLMSGHGLFSTLIGVRAGAEGYATETVGLIMSAYFAGQIAGVFWCRRVIRQVGHIRAFAAFAAIVSVLPLGHAYLVNPWAWALFRFAGGASLVGLIMVAESWINERADNANRGQVLSFYMIAYYAALGGGQFLLNMGDPTTASLFVLASALFSIAIVPVALTTTKAPPLPTSVKFSLRDLFRLSPLAVVGTVAAGLTNSAFFGMGPVFAGGIGFSLHQISWFMGLTILGGLILQWPLGRLSDSMDRRRVMVGVALLIITASVGLAFTAHAGHYWVLAYTVLYGGGAYTLYPLCTAHANDAVTAEQRVNVAGGLLIVYGLSASGGPLLAATVMGRVGPEGLYLQAIVIQTVLVAFAAYRSVKGRRLIVGLRRRFQPIPRSTPVITRLAKDDGDGDPED